MPRLSELEIFMLTTMTTTTDMQTDCFTSRTCVQGNKEVRRLHMDMVHTHSMKHRKKWEEPWDEVSVCAHTKGTSVMHIIIIAGNIGGN